MVFLDISKAFDRVWHKGLLHKLSTFGVSGSLLKWFSSYLSDRSQRVVLSGSASEYLTTNAGVLQGSILGPLLFLIYINDIEKDIVSDVSLFADDCSLINYLDRNLSEQTLNGDLIKIKAWASQWFVNFNYDKTVFMHYSKKREKISLKLFF